MKNSRIILTISGAIILLLCGYFLNRMEKMKQTQRNMSQFTSNAQQKEAFYSRNFMFDAQITNTVLPDIQCEEGATALIALSELVKHKPRLIYRYPHQQCNLCYEAKLNALHNMLDSTEMTITVFCSYPEKRDFFVSQRIYKTQFPLLQLYNIPANAFDWEVEIDNNPYFFVLHQDMKISQIYVPDERYPEQNRLYLEKIKRLLAE